MAKKNTQKSKNGLLRSVDKNLSVFEINDLGGNQKTIKAVFTLGKDNDGTLYFKATETQGSICIDELEIQTPEDTTIDLFNGDHLNSLYISPSHNSFGIFAGATHEEKSSYFTISLNKERKALSPFTDDIPTQWADAGLGAPMNGLQ
ncbi:MAG: hypothetical protein ACTSXQ_06810 [Alphaproteobacteria bacterium]